MPDHAEERGKIFALQPQPQIFAEDDRAELDRDERLEHVDQNDADGKLAAVHPVEVGQPRVMAAVLADIVVIKQKRGNDRAVAAASQVRAGGHADHQRDGSRGQFVHKYPPN